MFFGGMLALAMIEGHDNPLLLQCILSVLILLAIATVVWALRRKDKGFMEGMPVSGSIILALVFISMLLEISLYR